MIREAAPTVTRRGAAYCHEHGRRDCKNKHCAPGGKAPRHPVGPIRAAVLDARRRDPDLTWDEIASRAGWYRCREEGDPSRVKRALGLMPHAKCKRTGKHYVSTDIDEDRALKIIRAVHVDPWEVGL